MDMEVDVDVGVDVDRGRESFDRRAWADAYARLSAADRDKPLEPADRELLAVAAALTGREDESAAQLERAHQELVRGGAAVDAARCAFWLAFGLINQGDVARGGGWLARARRLLDDGGHDCAVRGYLIVTDVRQCLIAGDFATAHALIGEAVEIGHRFGDPDLVALARHIEGRGLVYQGQIAAGIALLDEVMVAVTAGEVSAIVVGTIYCGVIDVCQEIFDLRRAREWTTALTRWCESQPELVAFTGICLVHRAEIMQLHGAWPDAIDEARRSCERFLRTDNASAAGAAYYQQGEVHRLRGEFVRAEEAYREASRRGRDPHPGLAALRLAQGQVGAAKAAISRVLDEAPDHPSRFRLLPGYVEIMLAAGEVEAAHAGAAELADIAARLDAPQIRALAAYATGAVRLATGDPRAALSELRPAWKAWQELEVPYEAARVRVLIGLACRQLGDEDSAQMEFDAARWVFEQLGAVPDATRVTAESLRTTPTPTGGLTGREVEVLRLVAAGKTNRSIAADLFLSEKTVARHVSNILTKLDLSSRSAATAYAYEHDLV
jgi:DNA-binding CsgD family transcriptional regulator